METATLLSPEQKIELAKEVLCRVAADEYHPTQGVFVKLYDKSEEYFSYVTQQEALLQNRDKGLREHLIKQRQAEAGLTCRVCAFGALFLAYVEKYDGVRIGECLAANNEQHGLKYTAIIQKIRVALGREQAIMIEVAFECGDGYYEFKDRSLPERQFAICTLFGKYLPNNERLIAILQNMIDNNGTFSPPIPTDAHIRKEIELLQQDDEEAGDEDEDQEDEEDEEDEEDDDENED